MDIKNINLIAHGDCTGCGACASICPTNAIRMEYDADGFLFPQIDETKCVHCGKCYTACPTVKSVQHHDVPQSYAAWADDETRLKSSSGGMFTKLAEAVFAENGVVFGAVFTDDFSAVYHTMAENEEQLAPQRSSKYVQSETRDAYRQAKEMLDSGRKVMYTGCPCQIAGLYNYLGKDYDNLLTVDLVCHGANSVKAYHSFLRELTGGGEIESINFRDKKNFEWSTSMAVYMKNGDVKKAIWDHNDWNEAFKGGLVSRENCSHCPYGRKERISDLTLGDCWQVHRINPTYDDRKGTSLVLVNTEKGRQMLDKIREELKLCAEVPLDEVAKYNGQLLFPPLQKPQRQIMLSHMDADGFHTSLQYACGKKFDVGIVGWWFASNYGSSLTYYALGTILNDMGKSVLMIPMSKKDGNPWEAEIKQTVDFISKYFPVGRNRDFGDMVQFNFCDSFMLGSDQMWTPFTMGMVGYSFFLDFVDVKKRKIAFSTSFGHSDFVADPEKLETISDLLKTFTAVSVREKSGVEICRRQFDVEAEQVFDPVFLCSREKYDRLVEKINFPLPKKYLLCYILDPTPEKEAAAREIAEHEGCEILTILDMKQYNEIKNRWNTGTVLPKVTAEQFIYYIKNCHYLLTDSHHGTCFGIIYHRPYAAVANATRGKTRFVTVAEELGLMHRIFDDASDMIGNPAIYEPIDYAMVDQRLAEATSKAYAWLNDALNKPVKEPTITENIMRVKMERQRIGYELKSRADMVSIKLDRLQRMLGEQQRMIADLVDLNKNQAKEITDLRSEVDELSAKGNALGTNVDALGANVNDLGARFDKYASENKTISGYVIRKLRKQEKPKE